MPPKKNRQQLKAESREKILRAAAALFRKGGLEATGIDEIMAKAGLTAGAFYAHFKSKDALIEEVLWYTLPQSRAGESFLEFYLNRQHRDHPESGCPLATLGSDLARAHKGLKMHVTDRLERMIDDRIPNPTPQRKRRALKTLSLAVGALILSRITSESPLSDGFLNCYR